MLRVFCADKFTYSVHLGAEERTSSAPALEIWGPWRGLQTFTTTIPTLSGPHVIWRRYLCWGCIQLGWKQSELDSHKSPKSSQNEKLCWQKKEVKNVFSWPLRRKLQIDHYTNSWVAWWYLSLKCTIGNSCCWGEWVAWTQMNLI